MDGNLELKSFESMDEVAEHNTPEDCYVMADDIVFDLSNKIEESPILDADDCGTDASAKGDIHDFNEAHGDDFIGYMEEILQMAGDDEIEAQIQEEEAEMTETTEEREDDEGFFTTDTLAITGAIVILLVLVVSVVVMRGKKQPKKEE